MTPLPVAQVEATRATAAATAPKLRPCNGVLVRDSKNPDGAKLAFGAKVWQAFTDQMKRSLADLGASV